jgi:hypothetical protein
MQPSRASAAILSAKAPSRRPLVLRAHRFGSVQPEADELLDRSLDRAQRRLEQFAHLGGGRRRREVARLSGRVGFESVIEQVAAEGTVRPERDVVAGIEG